MGGAGTGYTLSVLATRANSGASISLAGTLNGRTSPSGNLTQLTPAPGTALFNGNPIP